MAGTAQNMVFLSGAQPSTTDEEQSVAGSSRARTASSNDLSHEEEDHIRHQEDRAEKSAPAVPDGSTNGKSHKIRKMLKTWWTKSGSSKSKLKVPTKIDQFRLSQRKAHEMSVLLDNLSQGIESVKYPFKLRENWQRIQGGDRWDGLLDPKHPMYAGMRSEIYRYGTFAMASYDAFDKNSKSRHRGCKYKLEDLLKEEVLKEVGLKSRGYEISHFLYATCHLRLPKFMSKLLGVKSRKFSNWIGFVAVCTSQDEIDRLGRRDIVVAWRGTVTKTEWIKDIQFWWKPIEYNPRNGNKAVTVESGFLSVYNCSNEDYPFCKNSAKHQALEAVKELVKKYEEEDKHKEVKLSITVTGHSLGGALSLLCAYDIAKWIKENSSFGFVLGDTSENASGKFFRSYPIPVTVFSFAGPRVGERAFKNRLEELGVAVLRMVNKNDIVPKLPGFLSYEHVGVEFEISQLTCEEKTSWPERVRHFLYLPSHLAKQHRLRGMLDTLSHKRLREYNEHISEALEKRRLLLRQKLRTFYLGTTFLRALKRTARYEPPEDSVRAQPPTSPSKKS